MRLGELLEIVGIGHRLFNNWTAQGLLDLEQVGQGYVREYSFEDLKRCLAMKSLTQIGLRSSSAIRLIRARTAEVRSNPVQVEINWQAIDTRVARLAKTKYLKG